MSLCLSRQLHFSKLFFQNFSNYFSGRGIDKEIFPGYNLCVHKEILNGIY